MRFRLVSARAMWDGSCLIRDPGVSAMTEFIDRLVASGDYPSALRPTGMAEDWIHRPAHPPGAPV
ncbi:hypothetical protein [Streptomyces nigra]|uniref:hypothetical protein n=2 Tax=Streptomyces nigra TaxID=1827580 RepID=UPI0036D04A0D